MTVFDGVRFLPEGILLSWPGLEILLRIESVTRRGDKIEREDRYRLSHLRLAHRDPQAEGLRRDQRTPSI